MKTVGAIIGIVVAIVVLASAIPIINSNDDKPQLDVFVVGGQSNTYPSIYVDADDATPIPTEGKGFYFGTDSAPTYNKSMDLASCGMYDLNDNGAARIGGLYPSFASAYTEKTGNAVYLIDTGLSGQPINTFMPGGSNYAWPGEVIGAAMSVIPSTYSVNVRGYIWIHGEGDSSNPIQTYEASMIKLHEIYSDGGLPIDLPTCYICKVRTAQGVNSSVAQQWLTENVPGFVMASTLPESFTTENGMLGPDELHYTQLGFNALGEDLAENIPAPAKPADYSNLILVVIPIVLVAIVLMAARMVYSRND